MIEPARVAQSFGAAAQRYEQAATVQRRAAETLQSRVDGIGGLWLDAGCGTGILTRALCQHDRHLIGLDLSSGMLAHARACTPKGAAAPRWIQADMARLPLASASLDGVISNFALQWLPRPDAFFQEAARVMRPGARLLVTTLLPGTLGEMAQAWRQADPTGVHVNRFVPAPQVLEAVANAGLNIVWRHVRDDVCHYPDARSAARAVKAVGAHNMNAGRPVRLTGKARWQAFEQAWEPLRTPQGLPLTYRILFLEAVKR